MTSETSDRTHLVVLFGGRSAEHEISIQSARNIIAAADPKKYDVVPIAITKEGRWCVGALPPAANGHAAIDTPPEVAFALALARKPSCGPAYTNTFRMPMPKSRRPSTGTAM